MEILIPVIGVAFLVFWLACIWKIFVKAGRKGWECLIPFWGPILFFSIAKVHWLWLIVMILCNAMAEFNDSNTFGNLLCAVISIAISIYFAYNLARAFGKNIILSIILSIYPLSLILMPILAFDKSEYNFDED